MPSGLRVIERFTTTTDANDEIPGFYGFAFSGMSMLRLKLERVMISDPGAKSARKYMLLSTLASSLPWQLVTQFRFALWSIGFVGFWSTYRYVNWLTREKNQTLSLNCCVLRNLGGHDLERSWGWFRTNWVGYCEISWEHLAIYTEGSLNGACISNIYCAHEKLPL